MVRKMLNLSSAGLAVISILLYAGILFLRERIEKNEDS